MRGSQRFSQNPSVIGIGKVSEHIETEELILHFKQDYEETRKMLEDKMIESRQAEENHKLVLDSFNTKLEELQKVIDSLKHIITEKDIQIKKLQKKLETQEKASKEELFVRDEAIEELNRTMKVLKMQNEENERMFYNNHEQENFFKVCLNEKEVFFINIS